MIHQPIAAICSHHGVMRDGRLRCLDCLAEYVIGLDGAAWRAPQGLNRPRARRSAPVQGAASMIIPCKDGGQVVVGECLWVPGAYLSTGNSKGSMGAVIDPAALDTLIVELTRVRGAIADRQAETKARKRKAA